MMNINLTRAKLKSLSDKMLFLFGFVETLWGGKLPRSGGFKEQEACLMHSHPPSDTSLAL